MSHTDPQSANSVVARIGIVTVSDRASAGVYEDLGGVQRIKLDRKSVV